MTRVFLLQGLNFFNMQLFLVRLLLTPFCFSSIIMSQEEQNMKIFKASLEKHFFPIINSFNEKGTNLHYLPIQINAFLQGSKLVSNRIYTEIYKFVDGYLSCNKIDRVISGVLLSKLREVFEFSEIEIRRLVESNHKAIRVLADICHLFKVPIQRLLFTCKAYGHDKMFKDAPVLLENIRNILLKADPNFFFDFHQKLEFIRASFDFYFSQFAPFYSHSKLLFDHLKSEIMKHINFIIEGIKNTEQPLTKYHSGLGNRPIELNLEMLDSKYSTTNESLWAFIMETVSETSDAIKSNCPDLSLFTDASGSVVDFINSDLLRYCHNSVPFTINLACSSVKKSAKQYFSSLKNVLRCQLDQESLQRLDEQIERAGCILLEALKLFNTGLAAKIREIVVLLAINLEDIAKFDFSIIAVSELVKDKARRLDL